jgi:hypothetical protein
MPTLETWLPVSSDKNEGCSVSGKKPTESVNGGVTLCKNRDSPTVPLLETTRKEWEEPVLFALRKQLTGLNQQYGQNLTTLVNVWSGVISLRESQALRFRDRSTH